MTALGVIDIYDTIKGRKGEYCKLCFRTSDERKLVEPVSLKLFLNAVDSSSLCKRLEKACYLCEARAASALRVRHAVALAEALGELFEWLDAGHAGLRTAVLEYLTGKRKTGGRVCRRAAQCAAALRRTGAGLGLSNTLVVDSHAKPGASAAQPGASAAQPGASAAQPGASAAQPGASAAQPRPSAAQPGPSAAQPEPSAAQPEPSAVQPGASAAQPDPTDATNHPISEGAVSMEQGAAPAQRCVAGDVTVLRSEMRLAAPDPRDGSLVMHPMVRGSDGNIYVPSLKLQVGEGNDLKSVSDQQLFLHTNTPLPLPSTKTTNKNPINLPNTQTDVGDFEDFLKKRNEWKNGINTTSGSKILNYDTNSKESLNGPNNNQPVPRNIQPVPRNIQPVPRNIQPVPRNIQPVPRNIQPVPRNIQPVPRNKQPVPRNKKPVPRNIQPVLRNIRIAPKIIQPVPRIIQSGPRNMENAPRYIQFESSNIQHGPNNIQHDRSEGQHGASEAERGAELKRGASQPVNGMAESKRPVLSIGTVDWENKIPMDVISFMDATDPNPSERIMQPDSAPAMAIISDVRSVQTPLDAQLDDDVVLVDNVECIDLC